MDLQLLISKSRIRLEDPALHPAVRQRAYKLIEEAHKKGIHVIITQAVRTKAYQDSLYAQGRTKPGNIVTNVRGGYSYHNYGLAVDFAVVSSDAKVVYWDTSVDSNKNKQKDWTEVGKIGEKLGFEWGGSWKNFVDMPHLQLAFGLTINQLLAGKKPPQSIVEKPLVPAQPVVKHDTPCAIVLNGKTLPVQGFVDGSDDRTYLPVRVIGEAAGAVVGYNNNKVTIGPVALGTSRLVGSTGYAHSREIADALGYNVVWKANPPTVTLSKKS